MNKVLVMIPDGSSAYVNPGTRWIERRTEPKQLEVFRNPDGTLFAIETVYANFPSRDKFPVT